MIKTPKPGRAGGLPEQVLKLARCLECNSTDLRRVRGMVIDPDLRLRVYECNVCKGRQRIRYE